MSTIATEIELASEGGNLIHGLGIKKTKGKERCKG